MAITFDEATRRILDGKNFAAVATLNPDGGPQNSVVWYERDEDTILFSTTTNRQKARNLAALAATSERGPSSRARRGGASRRARDPRKVNRFAA